MRWVAQVPLTTCALAASAASASPRWMTERDSRLSCVGFTRGAPGSSAAAGSSTAGSGWYSTSTSRAASRAVWRSTAAIAARTSPTQRTSSPSATKPGQSG